ncbi:MAG: hypothetical protein KBC91_00110 [Candidatus Omnitrophica bacterium]|nr:hypothetical protein [Candidatus Omnitrophota bacterium]
MSLIMDALEKVQRETKPTAPSAGVRPVMDQPVSVITADLSEAFTPLGRKETVPVRRGEYPFVLFLFTIILFTAALLGFQKISAGLSLPPIPVSTAAAPLLNAVQAARPTLGPGTLRGILQDPAGSFCILGEQILQTGDTWRGYTVLSIEAQQVVVQDELNQLLTLHLQEP